MWQSSAIPFVFVDGSGMCVCVCVCVHVQRIMKKQLGSSGEVKRKKVAAKRDIPLVDLSTCKYEVLRIALERNGWEEGSENNRNCHIVWTGKKLSLPLLFSFWLMGN
jgi:hypothetical protein